MTSRLATVVLLAACAADSAPDDLAPETPTGKSDQACPIVNAGIAITEPAPFSCGQIDLASNEEMVDVNEFWRSQVGLCACGPDYPGACEAATAHTGGWVYASPAFLESLRASSGSRMVTAYVLAHEFGHEIQGVFGVPPIEQVKELQADCLAGYYLGSLVCRGQVSERDINTTLAAACVIADGTGDPIADLNTHGTCEQRAGATARGMAGYLRGEPALVACRL